MNKILVSVLFLYFNGTRSEIEFEAFNSGQTDLMKLEIQEVIDTWQHYLKATKWQQLIEKANPRKTGCGLVYELGHPIDRPHEDLAIVDMQDLQLSEPHYHPEVEIYFILQGSGLVIIGGQEKAVKQNDIIVIPTNIAHFLVPEKDLVLGVVCSPPFNPAHYTALNEDNETVKFNKNQFDSYRKMIY